LIIILLGLGWGRSNFNNTLMTNNLQQTRLTVLKQSDCYRRNNPLVPVTSQMFCAALTRPKLKLNSACHGDSGGPFICKDADNSWTLNGIVSWGSRDCKTSDGYTVLTRVSQYVEWIVKKQLHKSNMKHRKIIAS